MRQVSNYIPFRIVKGRIKFFIQRRDSEAEVRPGLLGLWGGGFEDGEGPLDALMREMKEELELEVHSFEFLGEFEDEVPTHKHVYYFEADQDFEEKINIHEGDGGIFMNETEIRTSDEITPMEKHILFSLFEKLKTTVMA